MDSVTDTSPSVARTKLRRAVQDCSDRGLYFASKWAAELLVAVPQDEPSQAPQASTSSHKLSAQSTTGPAAAFTSTPARSRRPSSLFPGLPPTVPRPDGAAAGEFGSPDQSSFAFSPFARKPSLHSRASQPKPQQQSQRQAMDEDEEGPAVEYEDDPEDIQDTDVILLGKTYFDCRQYARAALVLKKCKGVKGKFLCLYSDFLAAEKTSQQDTSPTLSRSSTGAEMNPKLVELLKKLKDVTDPFLLYLKGIVLQKLGKRLEAVSQLVLSVVAYPYNWSCWTKIAQLIERSEELAAVDELLPQTSFMSHIFSIHAVLEIHSATDMLQDRINDLLNFFPDSTYLQGQRALINYHLREFDIAEEIFDDLALIDPYRLDDLDTYSNILYVMEKKAKLSQLAQRYTELDKNRPEVCCLVGNYYSLRADHIRAVAYFQRALKLDKEYLSAWTLMGHEYVELKNTHAAIEAYRRALDVNAKDYRAWFGLGQTYEILDMAYYAVSYFQRACALRPYDARMWSALGGCYEKLDNKAEALKAYKRSLLSSDEYDMAAYERVCRMCDAMNKKDLSVRYHYKAIEAAMAEKLDVDEYGHSLLAVAEYDLQHKRGAQAADWDLVERYLNIVMQGSNVNEYKARAKELQQALAADKFKRGGY